MRGRRQAAARAVSLPIRMLVSSRPFACALLWSAVAVTTLAAQAVPTDPPLLRPGEILHGELVDDDAPFRSRRLPTGDHRCDSFRIGPCEGDTVTLDVRSLDFACFVQLVDADGKVVAEDDSSAGAGDARLVLQASAAAGKTLVVVGKRSQRGSYEVTLRIGRPEPRTAAATVARTELALRRQEARHGTDSLPVAERLLWLARALCDADRAAEALPAIARALQLREQLDDQGEALAECHREAGHAHASLRQHHEALAAYRQCREVLATEFGTTHRGLPALLADVAQQQRALGDRPAAIATLREGLEIFDRQGNPDHLARLTVVVRLADLLEAAGDFTGARACVREAVPILAKSRTASLNLAVLQLTAADRLLQFGDVTAARTLFDASAAVVRKNLPSTHKRRLELACLAAMLANAESRPEDLRTALAEARQLFAAPGAELPWSPDACACLLAELDLLAGEPALAVARVTPVLTATAASAPGTDAHARQLVIVAVGLVRTGRIAEARELFTQTSVRPTDAAVRSSLLLAEAEAFFATDVQRARRCVLESLALDAPVPDLGRITKLDFLARCQVLCADVPAAMRTAQEASETALRRLARDLPSLPDDDALRLYAAVRPTLDLLLGLLRVAPNSSDCEAVFAHLQAWQSRVLRGEIGDRKRARTRLDATTLTHFDRLRALDAELAVLAAPSVSSSARQLARRQGLLLERQTVERQLALDQSPADAPTPLAPVDCRPHLAADEAFVQYVCFTRRVTAPGEGSEAGLQLAAFVVRRNQPTRVVWLGAVEPIERALASALQLLGRRFGPDATGRTLERRALQQLAQHVWQPLRPLLADAKRVAVVPDGLVAMVPMAALPADDQGRWLVEDVELTLVGATSDLVPDTTPPASPSLVLVGDVDFGPGTPFVPLPGTAAEITAIEALASTRLPAATPVTTLRGQRATIAALTDAVAGRTHVHLATHGVLDGASSPRPPQATLRGADDGETASLRAAQQVLSARHAGIALADANRGGAGILRGGPMSWLDLRSCELVVLSACETGLGQAFAGEQVLGLRRALRLAGAHRTMTTLWRVDDRSSVGLVESFYRHLWSGEVSAAAALRAAQLEALASCRRDHGGDALPARWAGFVVEGAR